MKRGFLNSNPKRPVGAAAAAASKSIQAPPTVSPRPSTNNAAANGQAPEDPEAQLPPASQPLNLQPLPQESTIKPAPFTSSTSSTQGPFKHAYTPSPTGIDSNLLILLHGLGDHLIPFHNLGKRLQATLPQTAVLALQGAHPIPWLSFPGDGEEAEQKHCSYWEAISPLGETLPPNRQDLGKFLKGFEEVMQEVTGRCGWPARAVHLLGFGHGATAALEGAVHWARKERSGGGEGRLGSIVAICGGLLSLPTFSPPLPIPTLYFHRPVKLSPKSTSTSTSTALNHLQRAFQHTTDLPFPSFSSSSSSSSEGTHEEEERMPSSQKEWDAIVHWWSEGGRWRNRGQWELQASSGRGGDGGGGGGEQGGVFRVA